MNTEWILGFIFGLLVVGVVALAIRKIIVKCDGKPGEYDERQLQVRGRAFMVAYGVLMVYLALWMLLNSAGVAFFANMNSVLLGMLLSITVFVAYSIFNDAYFRASERPATWIAVCVAVGLVNAILGVGRLVRGATIAERLYENANLMTAAMLLAIAACVLIKRAMDRRAEGE